MCIIKNMTKIIDDIYNNQFFDEIGNITKDETYSIKDSTDKSFSEDLDYNDLFENSENENVDFEIPDKLQKITESPIDKNNPNSNSNNSFSGNYFDNVNIGKIWCSAHSDQEAEWSCKNHCNKKFCIICFEKFGNRSEHGKLIKISERSYSLIN